MKARAVGLIMAAFALMALPAGVSAAVSGVFAGDTMNGQPIPCVTQKNGVRVCHGDESGPGGADLRLKSFDGTPLEVYVTLPPAPTAGADGDYPLVAQSHGWGDPTPGPNDTQYAGPTAIQWAQDGYVVIQLNARGWGDSCGTLESRLVNPAACANGYLHMDDYRYEARDVQHAVGLLVDAGLVDPRRIGVTGESYGGGVSLELATLKNRMMKPDGTLVPWTSPNGTPLHVAAAAPQFAWSDLVYALAPNGRTRTDQLTSTTADLSPIGVMKLSIVSGLYLVGTESAYYAPPLVDPDADLTTWYLRLTAGEPYSLTLPSVVQQIAQYHSPYYLLAGAYGYHQEAPAPLFMTNGFTDDIFPVDEALRYYNLVRSLYPNNPIALFDYDGGHQRGDNKPADAALVPPRVKAFFDHYVKGTGPQPPLGVTVLTQQCPVSTPSDGPYHAATWSALHPGEVDYSSAPAQTILSTGGDPVTSAQFDPVGASEFSSLDGQGWACQTAPDITLPGVASYALPAVTGSGYTLLGAPTVTADLKVTGLYAYIAAWLLDVDPATHTEILIARGLYRINPKAPNGRQTFQLHPGAHHFAAGHVPTLELMGADTPYARPSNIPFLITVSKLKLQLPVHEAPNAPGTPAEVTSSSESGSPGQGNTVSAKSSGGGALGWLTLLPLASAALWRRRRLRRKARRDAGRAP